MPVIDIDDPRDPLLDDYRNVPDPELIERRGLFIAEGRLVVRRLLESPRWIVRSMMVTTSALGAVEDLVGLRPSLPVYLVSQASMNEIAGFHIHRGCLAIGERSPMRSWNEVASGSKLLLALEHIGNADNIGALFRAAAAFGVDGVLLGPSCTDPLYRKAVRTSMGAALAVDFAKADPWPDVLYELRGRGWNMIGMTPAPGTALLRHVIGELGGMPIVLVLGHEGDGLSLEALAACTHHVRIPITDAVDSLNVAVAGAIALYEVAQCRSGM